MPAARLTQPDTLRAMYDPAACDLPFVRLPQRVYNLRRFKCSPGKDSRQWKLYATFQMEMYAFKLNYAARAEKMTERCVAHHLTVPYSTLQHLTAPYSTLHITLQHLTSPHSTLHHLTAPSS
jgi:hypothetical protein